MYTNPPKLTARLAAIADMITPGSTVADIGTDHAYLPIWLCMTGRCQYVIASDIKKGPMHRAEDMTARYGQADKISVRMGAGLDKVEPGEADCIVIAGMGGLVIANILEQGKQVTQKAKQIILQPMTAIPELRTYLCENGYCIVQEILEREDNKIYHILSVSKDMPAETYTDFEYYIGKQLLENEGPYTRAYLEKQQKKLKNMLSGLEKTQSSEANEKETRVRAYLEQITEIIENRYK